MHILQSKPRGNIVHTVSVTVVVKPLLSDHLVYFCLCRQSQTTYVGLRQDDAKQAIIVASEPNNMHCRLRKQIVVQCNGIEGLLRGGIDGGTFLDNRGVAFSVVDLCFGPLGYHGTKVARDYLFGVVDPQPSGFRPLLNELLLMLVYLPTVWEASLAA